MFDNQVFKGSPLIISSTPELEEELAIVKTMRFRPGMFLPIAGKGLSWFADSPASWSVPIDWSQTRWPEGAEL